MKNLFFIPAAVPETNDLIYEGIATLTRDCISIPLVETNDLIYEGIATSLAACKLIPKPETNDLIYEGIATVELEYEVDKESDEDTDDVKMDSEERICFHMKEHDLVIKRFKKELKKFGLSDEEEEIFDFLKRVDKKFKIKEEK